MPGPKSTPNVPLHGAPGCSSRVICGAKSGEFLQTLFSPENICCPLQMASFQNRYRQGSCEDGSSIKATSIIFGYSGEMFRSLRSSGLTSSLASHPGELRPAMDEALGFFMGIPPELRGGDLVHCSSHARSFFRVADVSIDDPVRDKALSCGDHRAAGMVTMKTSNRVSVNPG